MAENTQCPGCGLSVAPGEEFCPRCGIRMNDPEYQDSSGRTRTYEDQKQIKRTSTGIGVMIGGLILSWIPVIQYLGEFLEFIGAILIILGVNPFGKKHTEYVTIAVVLYVVSFLGAIVIALSLTSSILSGTNSINAIISSFRNYMIGAMAMSALAGISQILLVLGISSRNSRMVLMLAFISQMAVLAVIYAVIIPMVASAASRAVSIHSTAPIISVDNKLSVYRLMDAFPALIFAAGYFMVRQRIEKKEVPLQTQE